MQVVGMVSIFQSSPKEAHVAAIKIIFIYVKEILEYGLWYPKRDNFTLKAFTNADWVGSIDDRKRTSGAEFYLGDCLVSWLSKNQSYISLSTTKGEYIATASCCTQVIWMKHTLEDLLVKYEDPIIIHCENISSINICKNRVMHSKTKHISIKYNFLREKVSQKNGQIGVYR